MRTALALLLVCGTISAAWSQTQTPEPDLPEKEKFELISLSREINTPYHDSAPVISPDGKTLYFTVNDHPENTYGKGSQDIWFSELGENGLWTQAKHMSAPFNSRKFNQVLSVSPDGHTLLIRGGNGKDALGFSICQRVNGAWQKPTVQKIDGFDKMCKGRFNGAFLALDALALLLYFSETEAAQYSDLYVSFPEKNNSWSRPQLISALNTRLDEFGPYLAPDNQTLYFASNRGGGLGSSDIYKTTRQDDSWLRWSKPENLETPINTGGFDAYYAIGNADTLVFTTRAHMSADGGHLDIFTLRRVREKKALITLTGRVLDAATNEAIPGANIRILQDGEATGAEQANEEDAYFESELPGPGSYELQVNAEGYLAGQDSFMVEPTKKDLGVYRNIYLKRLEVGLSVRLNNIFFDFDKSTLRPESFPELDKVKELMEQNPNLYIEIGGHTDDKGSDAYNEQLSQGRAEAVRAYLLEQWIEPERVSAKGYGKSKPEVPNDSDENRQINRRVEFTIIR
jgi:OOP family OmpA-OmpF porin